VCFLDQYAKDAPTFRQLTDALCSRRANPNVDELGELTVRTEDA
jgi:hypothetical protein